MAEEFKLPEEFNKKLDDMFRGVSEKLDQTVKETRQTRNELTTVKSTVDKLEKNPPVIKTQERGKSSDYNKLFAPEGDSETKEEVEKLKSTIQKLESSHEESQKAASFEKEVNDWNVKTVNEIPLIKDRVFANEVTNLLAKDNSEIHHIDKVTGLAVYKPDAVYKKALIVENRWLKQNHEEAMAKHESLNVGNFGESRRVTKEEVTDVQIEIAQRLGIDPTRAREIYKPWNQSGKKQTLQNHQPKQNIHKTIKLGDMQNK